MKKISSLLIAAALFSSTKDRAEDWDSTFNTAPPLDVGEHLGPICVLGGDLYAAVVPNEGWGPYSHILRYSSGSWIYVPNSTLNGSIYALAGVIGGTGSSIGARLFVGGEIYGVGTTAIVANNIAVLSNPASTSPTWSALISGGVNGTDDAVWSLYAFPFFVSSRDAAMVYVGGNFNTAGDKTSPGIARWSGFGSGGYGWENVGGGVDSASPNVRAIDIDYSYNPYNGTTTINNVYLTGKFTKTIGPVNYNFARLSGSTWINAGRGLGATFNNVNNCAAYWDLYNNMGYALARIGTTVYIGGYFFGLEDKDLHFNSGQDYFPIYCENDPCLTCYDLIGVATYSSSSGVLTSSSSLNMHDNAWCFALRNSVLFTSGGSFYAAKLVSGTWSQLTTSGIGTLDNFALYACSSSSAVYFATDDHVFKYNYP
jgi:hypothetical protein